MFKWLGKLKWWKGTEDGPSVHEFGQYCHKPVMARTLSVILDITQPQVVALIQNADIEVYLNDDLIQGSDWARRRLESGGYELRIPQQNKIWRFFIA